MQQTIKTTRCFPHTGLILLGLLSASAHAQPQISDPALKPVAQQLASKSAVPVLLPSRMTIRNVEGEPLRYHAKLEETDKSGYAIRIQDRSDCGTMSCLVGYLEADRTPTPSAGGEAVLLANGLRGSYTPPQQKIAGELKFSRNGIEYRFRVGYSAQQKQELINMANSALQAGPRQALTG